MDKSCLVHTITSYENQACFKHKGVSNTGNVYIAIIYSLHYCDPPVGTTADPTSEVTRGWVEG